MATHRHLASQSNSADGIDLATDDACWRSTSARGMGRSLAVGHAGDAANQRPAGSRRFRWRRRPDLAFAGYDYLMMGGFVTDAGASRCLGPSRRTTP